MPDYVLENVKWRGGAFGTGGGTVTWAADSTVPTGLIADIIAAFADWARYANITFQQVASTASSMIDITMGPIDGLNRILGVTQFAFNGTALISANIQFDSGELWTVVNGHGQSAGGANFFSTALHEIGHALGLGHYNDLPAIMNSVIRDAITDLTSHDINGIRAVYGAAPIAPPAAAFEGLVDDNFYFAHYPDVAAAGVDAKDHYDGSGWHEGRDPNAFFSTTGYLAANPSVRSANVNPLDDYHKDGWSHGRDPSAQFDAQIYLERNPDVRAAGVDPLEHFLFHGQAEGRPIYPAVGEAASFTHGSFDAEFYLLSNVDVARAAIAAGGDPFEYAYNHFHQRGWLEGRNPNSVFDVKAYLTRYTDVRAAGVDPLEHYDTSGWREGRDPSGTFDTNGYLSHYADIAAAHVDPLQHYLAHGIHEGRLAFGDGILV